LGLKLPRRMIVARLPNGTLQLHSPNPITPDLLENLHQLGRVSSIVAPTLFHDTFLADTLRLFSECRLYAPESLHLRGDLANERCSFEAWPENWATSLRPHTLQGCKVEETVFLHAPSRTLLVSDLVMNIGPTEPFATRLFFRLNGAYQRLTPTHIFRQTITDRRAFRASVDHILSWDFNRLVMTHGAIVETGAKERLIRELRV